jgi:lipopolysaccharide/colanic/teichoic acid biosynthesis glycosyltransferase
VLPGITGLWQVEGRSSPYFHDWIEYDVHYVFNQGLALDLTIHWKTLLVALTGGR